MTIVVIARSRRSSPSRSSSQPADDEPRIVTRRIPLATTKTNPDVADLQTTSHRCDMPNLTKLIAILVMTTGFGLAACKKDPEKATEAPVAKPTEPATPEVPKPTAAKPDDPKPTAAADLPAECAEYKAGIEKLATCDKLPQASRDAMKQAYETTSASWASVPAEGKAALATACKSAADALKQTATACQ